MEKQKLKPIAYFKEIQGQIRLIVRYIKEIQDLQIIYSTINERYNFFKDAYCGDENDANDKVSNFLILTVCNELYDEIMRQNSNDELLSNYKKSVDIQMIEGNLILTEANSQKYGEGSVRNKMLKNFLILSYFRILLEKEGITQLTIDDQNEKDSKEIDRSIDEYDAKIAMLPELPTLMKNTRLHQCNEICFEMEGIIKI
jgi:hypothetical protein